MARSKDESEKIAETIPNRIVEGNIVIKNPKTRMNETGFDSRSNSESPDIVNEIGKSSSINMEMKKELDEARSELKE